jgi:hypothetical protein
MSRQRLRSFMIEDEYLDCVGFDVGGSGVNKRELQRLIERVKNLAMSWEEVKKQRRPDEDIICTTKAFNNAEPKHHIPIFREMVNFKKIF